MIRLTPRARRLLWFIPLAGLAHHPSFAETYEFTYVYVGTFEGNPRPNPGSVLTGAFDGTIDPSDPTGNTIIINSFLSASLRGIPYASISSNEFNTVPSGGTPVMTFSGPGTNFRACPSGFTQPAGSPDDCNFGNDGGFGIFYNDFRPNGASFSGVRGQGTDGRATDVPFFPANWTLTVNDGDGIASTIDGTFTGSFNDQSAITSDDFTDQHLGGTTSGTIVDRADQVLQVTDHSPDGVVLSADGGTGTAHIQMCTSPVTDVFLTDGDQVIATCGSFSAEALAGTLVVMVGGDITVTLGTGASALLEEMPGSILSVTNLGEAGSGSITIDDGGTVIDLGPEDPPAIATIEPDDTLDAEPFENISASIETDDDETEIEGSFELGEGTDGIKPHEEVVTITIGTLELTIPAGEFDKDGGEFEFEGTVDGVELEVEIERKSGKKYEYEVEIEADLGGSSGPVEVSLLIGDDTGMTMAEIEDD